MTRNTPLRVLGLAAAVAAAAAGLAAGCGTPGGGGGGCGDGEIVAPERCDDGNREDGDGCSSACTVESGYSCVREPSRCSRDGGGAATCGDGVVTAPETCDDGGRSGGDGCSRTCATEAGYVCVGAPSVCTPGRPDAGVDADAGTDVESDTPIGGEDAADGETGEGSDADAGGDAVTPDAGDVGGDSDTTTAPGCGDGVVGATERCDDGNTSAGDGCDGRCRVEVGFICEGEPSVCRRGGDPCVGVDCSGLDAQCVVGRCNSTTGACEAMPLDDRSACDDGNGCTVSDGCSAGVCTGSPRECTAGPCQTAACDAATGECVASPAREGETCGDSGECGSSVCRAGACVSETDTDGRPCGAGTGECGAWACAAGSCTLTPTAADCAACSGGLCNAGACVAPIGTRDTWTFDDGALPPGLTLGGAGWTLVTDSAHSGPTSARSAPTGHSSEASVSIPFTLVTAGAVTFWYHVDSESGYDFLRARIDGSEVGRWSGSVGWTQARYSVGAGSHTLQFAYTKDANTVSGADAAWVDDLVFEGAAPCGGGACAVPLWVGGSCAMCNLADGTSCDTNPADCSANACSAGACVATPVADCTACGTGGLCTGGACAPNGASTTTEGFESGGAPDFRTGGDDVWGTTTGRAHTGRYSITAGYMYDYDMTWLRTSRTLAVDGTVEFWLRTSTEACCDRLTFFIDGAAQGDWGGNTGWTFVSFPLAAGSHTLQWEYEKDFSFSSGDDQVWVDDVAIREIDRCPDATCSTEVWDGGACLACPVSGDGCP